MDQACEIYISNQYYEILKLSRIDLLGIKENILLHSSDGGTFFVSKFIFNFLSSLANPEADSILTPIPSTHLGPICHVLNLKKDTQGDITLMEEDINHLGLDFQSCKNLVSALNEQNVKVIKRDPNYLDKDIEKQCKKVDEPEKETGELESITRLDQPDNVQVENHFSAHEEISKEQFALVAIEEINGQNFEYNENIEDANIIDKDPDRRNEGTAEIKQQKSKMKYKGNRKTTARLVEGMPELKSLECKICGKTYEKKKVGIKKNLLRYNKHVRRHETFLKCNQCQKLLQDKEGLEKHKENVHSLKVCHICSFTSKAGPNGLKYHIERIHQVQMDENKPIIDLKCNVEGCEKIFYRQGDLRHHHQHLHTSFECPFCHKMFRKQHIRKHIDRIHHNKSTVYCEKCGKGFIYQSLLDQHEEVDHQGVRYQCRYPDCQFKDQQYRDKSNRGAHERNKHGAQYTKFLTEGN